MNTTFKEENGNFVMKFEGRLDTAAAPQVEKEMQQLYECDGHDVVLDCTDMEYISSSGLRLFLGLLKETRAHGGSVSITGMSDYIRTVFDQTGFSKFFKIL